MIRWARHGDLTSSVVVNQLRAGRGEAWRRQWLASVAHDFCLEVGPFISSDEAQALLIELYKQSKPGNRVALTLEFAEGTDCDWRGALATSGLLTEGLQVNDPLPGDPRAGASWLDSPCLLSCRRRGGRLFSIGMVLRRAYSQAELEGRDFRLRRASPSLSGREAGGDLPDWPLPVALSGSGARGFALSDLALAYHVGMDDAVGLLNELLCAGLINEHSATD